MDTFKEVINNISDSIIEDKDNSHFKNIFKSTKNLMFERCATQRKFNRLFTKFRSSILPDIISNWNSLSVLEQQKFKTVNDFYCGLHFLVALGDQAEASLKIWESFLTEDVSKLRSLAHGGYSVGDSGTLRLVKSACKSVSERGCEKSGRMVHFATFLKEKYDLNEIPLYPFLGHRFNIIFLNGAGVFALYNKLLTFFDQLTKQNKLLTAVFQDLHYLPYQVECCCLGLIQKLVTGPLWRKMEMEKTALNTSLPYKIMLKKFEKWCDNAFNFVKGEESLFPEYMFIKMTYILNLLNKMK